MSDLNCPYCGAGGEVIHDDGFGYAEDTAHEQECGECGKLYIFHTSISFDYEPSKADCLNGSPHKMVPVHSYPNAFPNWKRCKDCDHEVKGKYDPSVMEKIRQDSKEDSK